MKPCDTFCELLPEFLEGALDAEAASDVATHLAECPECRGELRFVRDLTAAARSLPQLRPDDTVALRMLEGIRRTELPARRQAFGPVLDLEDLAAYLRLDVEDLDPYLADIPSFELGGKLLFRRQTVEEWVRNREQSLGFAIGTDDTGRVAVAAGTQTGGAQWTL
jgi:hypothetical protein